MGCSNWLVMNGMSNCIMMLLMVFYGDVVVVDCDVIISLMSVGVMKILSRFDVDVVYMVVGMLFFVIDVNVIDDWIVDGSVYRNSMFVYSVGVMSGCSMGFSVRLSSGNSVNVLSSMIVCSCQWVVLVMMVLCDSFVLCRKNSRLIVMLVVQLNVWVVGL